MKIFKKKLVKEVTIVTALINIGRGGMKNDFDRSYQLYLDRLDELIKMPSNLIIYADREAANQLAKKRSIDNTLVIPFGTGELDVLFPHKAETDKIRQNTHWLNQADWLKQSPQAKLEWYNPLVMSKITLLAKAAELNPFRNSHFYWLDAGITSTVHPGYFWHDQVFETRQALMNQFTFIAYPYTANKEVHGFDITAMQEFSRGNSIDYVARGGFFGGPIETIQEISMYYDAVLHKTLSEGFMGTEESIFTILCHLHPEHIQVLFIQSDGLLSTFFEQLKNNNLQSLCHKPEIDDPLQLISHADLEDWHRNGHIHYQRTLKLLKSIIPADSAIHYIDVGCSTGSFYLALTEHLKIKKALLIEPLLPALAFAQDLLKSQPIQFVNVACGANEDTVHFNVVKSENNNLGACFAGEEPSECSITIKQSDLSTLFKAYQFEAISLIKIHTPNRQNEILEGLLDFVKTTPDKPLILFDYGYYESKDTMLQLLSRFWELGYQKRDIYSNWGADIVLIPETNTIYPATPLNQQDEVDHQHYCADKAVTYILTFNFPSQLELLRASFEESGQFLLKETQIVLINNSDDSSTDSAYAFICEKYNMEEIKKGNLGICGGRQLAAEHFANLDAKYMFFFEDDMLLQKPLFNQCKNGFPTWAPDLFEKSIEIMEKENFDFLKLSFTEFFGDHKTQWAWHNVPEDFRQAHFTANPVKEIDGTAQEPPQTIFDKIGSVDGLGYIDGEVYYSNWPHIISQAGNQKMFLETKWERPYEQTWMSHFYQLTIKKQLHPALLLASPILHQRVFHYEAALRKENNG